MAWGGSLNKHGSNYIRKLREADKVIEFLENFKNDLTPAEKNYFTKTIEIITDYMTEISEGNK
jgi:hypothetical protein